MYLDGKILIGKTWDMEDVVIYPSMANRHGLIAGATGTGKTITLKVLAESFSDAGVPVFLADAKGDLAGMFREGDMNENVVSRVQSMGLAERGFTAKAYPTTFWDVFQEKGIPLRTTVSEMGPLLLGRVLGLNETQSAILNVVFKIADDEGLILIDTKDLRSMLRYVSENASEYSMQYGSMAKQSIAAIIRAVVALEAEGGEMFFGEPALNIEDLLKCDMSMRGMIHVLASEKLMLSPKMYAAFMLWLISELFESLPEAGDMAKPRMVFFFDEAHMLFDDAPKELVSKVEQLVKLIRSKGVGIYFVTQNPRDLPDGVLSQLGNKIQHALRAYTPAEQKSIKAAAQGFRENPAFDTVEVLSALGTGQALISVLGPDGVPTIVQKAKVLPPQSLMGAVPDADRAMMIQQSMYQLKYAEMFDRDSAYELLERLHLDREEAAAAQAEADRLAKEQAKLEAEQAKALAKQQAADEREQARLEREAKKAEERAAAAEERERLRKEREEAKAKERAAAAAAKEEERKKKVVSTEMGKVGRTVAGTVGREVGNTVGKSVGGTFGKKLGGNLGATLARGIFNTFTKK